MSETSGQVFVPWIVRGEDGNLKLQTQPPEHFIKAMAVAAETGKKKKKQKKDKKETQVMKKGAAAAVAAAEPPKLSKAARRFYNENFRDSAQRLSKVLATAGGRWRIQIFNLVLVRFNAVQSYVFAPLMFVSMIISITMVPFSI